MAVLKKPMLAGKVDFAIQRYPVLGAPKLDGIRALVIDGEARSRSLKHFPNLTIQRWFAAHAGILPGLDGELIVGDPTDPNVFQKTDSGVMTMAGEPEFTYYVFDRWDCDGPYEQRIRGLDNLPIRLVEHVLLDSEADVLAYEERMLALGYEGIILRDPAGPYKQGRSTTREGYLLKLKRWDDAEGVIIGYEEQMHNGNAATVNALGHTQRSSHQANKIGKGTLGAWVVRGLTAFDGIEFNVSGLTAKASEEAWQHRDEWVQQGRIVTYKYFNVGIKNKPRHPKFKGYRSAIDL